MRVITSPADTRAVVISLPLDIQSHAYDYPVKFFEPRHWKIHRPLPAGLVVPTVPHADLPGNEVCWDVAPAEVSSLKWVRQRPADYEAARGAQRWFG